MASIFETFSIDLQHDKRSNPRSPRHFGRSSRRNPCKFSGSGSFLFSGCSSCLLFLPVSPPTRSAISTMLADVYSLSALPFSSEALLVLKARTSFTHYQNKIKHSASFWLSKIKKQLPRGVCVCACASVRACACAYPYSPEISRIVFPIDVFDWRSKY